jgi:hypothetical protein
VTELPKQAQEPSQKQGAAGTHPSWSGSPQWRTRLFLSHFVGIQKSARAAAPTLITKKKRPRLWELRPLKGRFAACSIGRGVSQVRSRGSAWR